MRILTAIAAILCGIITTSAQLTASKAFVEAPHKVIPLLDRNARLDMLDYFNSGLDTKTSNKLNGASAVTAVSPELVSVQMTDASTYDIAVLPAAGDTLVAIITTIATPTPDSKMAVYSKDFSRELTQALFSKPALKEWITDGGFIDTVEGMVPFLLISYSYSPTTKTLTLTNNTKEFLSEDIYSIVDSHLRKQLSYVWNGKRFVKQK